MARGYLQAAREIPRLWRAFLTCVERATALGHFSEWSRLCEDELFRLRRSDYPLPSEILPEPALSPLPLDVAPIGFAKGAGAN